VTWLVTGGAGYIGAHVVDAMRTAGESVVVLDDLTTGEAERIDGVPLVVGSTLDRSLVEQTIRGHDVDGTSFVFSSSAAVYGAPDGDQVSEDIDCRPVNPYGETKLVGERLVSAVATASGLRYASLRYFNVAGSAAPVLADRGNSNLVPMVFERLSAGLPPLIFGTDYPTPDGTCIRDFVHVSDIASAHVAAAHALAEGRISAFTANIGNGSGVSVREMVETIREVTGTAQDAWAEPLVVAARPGDPPRVVASAARIRAELGWQARWTVQDMVASAWEGWRGGPPSRPPRADGGSKPR
jgi:UDP-glucose 4-epimerase